MNRRQRSFQDASLMLRRLPQQRGCRKGTGNCGIAVVKPPVRVSMPQGRGKKAGEKVAVEEAAPVASDLAEAAKEAEFKVEEKAEKTEKVAAEKNTPKEKRVTPRRRRP